MTTPVMLVDGNNILYRMSYAMFQQGLGVVLNDGEKIDTGPMFLTLKTLIEVFTLHQAVPVMVWDPEKGRKSLKRRKMHKEYKSGREPANEIDRDFHKEVADQRTRLQNFLGQVGMFQARATGGWEADDVLARLAKKLSRKRDVLVLTNDKDLLPLLGYDRVRILSIGSRKYAQPGERYEVRGKEWFAEEYPGITPEQWSEFRSLAGDTSDKVQGVKGIGRVWGLRLISEYGTAVAAVEAAEEIQAGKLGAELLVKAKATRKKLLGQIKTVQKAYKVLALNERAPYEWLPRPADRSEAQRLVRKLKFRSFLAGTLRQQLKELYDACDA